MNDIIKKIQEIEYEALKVFSDFCKENEITFFLRGGSVLGAVKYSGFIPWDDDLDVAVPRKDYERLINISRNKILGGKFIINSYRYNSSLPCYFPRMVLMESERIKFNLPQNTNLGLHIMDIFPLDGAPNIYLCRKIYYVKVYFFRALASLGTIYSGDMVNMHTPRQQLVIDFLRLVKIDKLVKQQNIYHRLEKLYQKYNYEKCKYAGTITASKFAKEIFPIDVWGHGEFVHFNELSVMVPQKYDIYLKQLYGEDYLEKEPDIRERKSHLR